MLRDLSNQLWNFVPFALGPRLVQGLDITLSLLGITSLAARVSCLSEKIRTAVGSRARKQGQINVPPWFRGEGGERREVQE